MHNRAMCSPRWAWLACVAAVAAGVVGCGSATEDRPAKWSFISAAITEPSCATVNCHSDLTQKSGLNLSSCKVGYYNLINRNFVIPNDPGDSEIVARMNAEGGLRMPPDQPLPIADIYLIEDWINGGAVDDCGSN
jgi:cytochrome c